MKNGNKWLWLCVSSTGLHSTCKILRLSKIKENSMKQWENGQFAGIFNP